VIEVEHEYTCCLWKKQKKFNDFAYAAVSGSEGQDSG